MSHPLSRHRAHRAQPEDEDGKRQPFQDAPSPPERPIVPDPAAKPTAVANLRLVRTPIRIRTMIVIIHDGISLDCMNE